MRCTFGIITHPDTCGRLERVVAHIMAHGPFEKEIVVVGGNPIKFVMKVPACLTHIPFNESFKPAWITKKKNIITRVAQYENIVYMHDYIDLMHDWDMGFDELEPWDVCMSKIFTQDGQRFRDWVAWDDPDFGPPGGRIHEKWCPPEGIYRPGSLANLPYDYNKSRGMYISGAYWIAKKEFMLKYPLNEELSWGEGEDVEWSYRARKTWRYKMNTKSRVRLNKRK